MIGPMIMRHDVQPSSSGPSTAGPASKRSAPAALRSDQSDKSLPAPMTASASQDSPAPKPIIRLVKLRKSFGRVPVLRGIDLDFPKGQTTVVLAHSGCGKSVMLKHIIGLLKPDSGQVWFDGQRIDYLNATRLSAIRQQFGFLFQQSALFDSMTVRENIMFPLL